MKRSLIAGLVIVALAIPGMLWARSDSKRGHVDAQAVTWTNDNASTSNTKWRPIPGLKALEAYCPGPAASNTLSLFLTEDSAPVDVRVVLKDLSLQCVGKGCSPPPKAKPGVVTFEGRSNSFTFVRAMIPGLHGSAFRAQWRSPTGEPVTMDKGTMNLLWDAPRQCV